MSPIAAAAAAAVDRVIAVNLHNCGSLTVADISPPPPPSAAATHKKSALFSRFSATYSPHKLHAQRTNVRRYTSAQCWFPWLAISNAEI